MRISIIMHPDRLRVLPVFALLLAALTGSNALAATGPPDWLLGAWVLNSERTHEEQPKQSGSGFDGLSGIPSISWGGIPIPIPGGSPQQAGGSGAREPGVLRCAEMAVQMRDENVHFSYQGVSEETLKPGNDQGRKTSWNTSRLTSKYETSTRKVSKSYQLRKDGSLLVKVKLNPNGAKSITHVRVFERPTG